MSDAKYTKLEDGGDAVARVGWFRAWLRRLFKRAPPTPEQVAREAEVRLRRLMRQLPAWMSEQSRIIERNELDAKEFMARGDKPRAMVHARAVLAHRRYHMRLAAFYSNVNEALLMQQNAKVARGVTNALGVASQALDKMMASMKSENIVRLMQQLDDHRDELDRVDEELARPIGQTGELQRRAEETVEYDAAALELLEELCPTQRQDPIDLEPVTLKPETPKKTAPLTLAT